VRRVVYQVVGFFDVAARLRSGNEPIAAGDLRVRPLSCFSAFQFLFSASILF